MASQKATSQKSNSGSSLLGRLIRENRALKAENMKLKRELAAKSEQRSTHHTTSGIKSSGGKTTHTAMKTTSSSHAPSSKKM
jgi:regulator of replication initiation timing